MCIPDSSIANVGTLNSRYFPDGCIPVPDSSIGNVGMYVGTLHGPFLIFSIVLVCPLLSRCVSVNSVDELQASAGNSYVQAQAGSSSMDNSIGQLYNSQLQLDPHQSIN